MAKESSALTPELSIESSDFYLIRKNNEPLFLVEGEKEAILAIDSLASAHQEDLTNDKTRVYREDLNKGRKIKISTQHLGILYDGTPQLETTLDFINISIASVLKGRHEREEKKDKQNLEECEEDIQSSEESEKDDSSSSESEDTEEVTDSEEEGLCCDSEEWSD